MNEELTTYQLAHGTLFLFLYKSLSNWASEDGQWSLRLGIAYPNRSYSDDTLAIKVLFSPRWPQDAGRILQFDRNRIRVIEELARPGQ